MGVLPIVTSARREALARLGVVTVEDLLRFAPRRHEDRRHPVPVARLVPGESVLVIGRVVTSRAFRTRRGMSILEATVEDDSGSVRARWFQRGYVPRPLVSGQAVAVPCNEAGNSSGSVSRLSPNPATTRRLSGGPLR